MLTISDRYKRRRSREISSATWIRLLHVGRVLQGGDTVLITKMIRQIHEYADEAGLLSLYETNAMLLSGHSVLHIAVRCAELDVIEYVISHGLRYVDVNAQDCYGQTPLQIALKEGRETVAQLLLRAMYTNQGQ